MRLSDRDVEILRTVARLQLVKTTMLARLFRTARTARRRLAALREGGLLAGHQKGLPGGERPGVPVYYRMTDPGVAALEHACPTEEIPDTLVRRSRAASLRFWEHRDELADLYLSIILGGGAADPSARAGQFQWRTETSQILSYRRGGKRRTITPDATISRPGLRVFLELDRSTESRKRCQAALEAYARFFDTSYETTFGDRRQAYVLYATRSTARAASLRKALRPPAAVTLVVVPRTEAIGWLTDALVGDQAAAAAPAAEAAVSAERAALRAMYRDFYALLRRREEAGESVTWPASVREAHALLEGN